MEGMGLKFTTVVVRRLLGSCLVLWLAHFRLKASPNNPNGGFNLPPAAHPTPTPTPPPSYNVPSVILQ